MEILEAQRSQKDHVRQREEAEVAAAVLESNPNDYSNEYGYTLEGLNNPAVAQNAAMNIQDPAEGEIP